jgi:DNA-binding NarL/FixJ family response regulator
LLAAAPRTTFVVETPDNLNAWAREVGPRIVVAVIGYRCGWSDIENLASNQNLIVVVITSDLAFEEFVRALTLGAGGVIHADTSSQIIMSVVSAAVRGEVVLPAEAARLLAKMAMRGAVEPVPLSQLELDLIRRLALGVPLVQVARDLGWSERTIRRRLQNVCLKLGVSNRTQAVARAGRLGLTE